MSEDIGKIIVGNQQIGIARLTNIIDEVKAMKLSDEVRLQAILLEKVKINNYVPPSKEKEYAEALLKFHKKSAGIPIEEEDIKGIIFRILGPGCAACEQLERDIKSILAELNVAANVEHIRDINEIANFGVLGTPALIKNKKVLLSGRTIPRIQLKKLILEEISRENQS